MQSWSEIARVGQPATRLTEDSLLLSPTILHLAKESATQTCCIQTSREELQILGVTELNEGFSHIYILLIFLGWNFGPVAAAPATMVMYSNVLN